MKSTLDVFEWKIKNELMAKAINIWLPKKKAFVYLWKQNNMIVTTVATTKTANAGLKLLLNRGENENDIGHFWMKNNKKLN